MKLKVLNRENRFFFGIVLAAIAFIVICAFLIWNVSVTRKRSKSYVENIGIASQVEGQTFEIVSRITRLSDNELRHEAKTLSKIEIKSPNEEVMGLITLLYDLQNISSQNKEGMRGVLENSITEIDEKCKEIISVNRDKLTEASDDLAGYWIYTFVLLGIAALTSILLALATYFVKKTRESLIKLHRQNKLLLNSSIDCVMSADAKGRITEFNAASEKAFGYKYADIKKLGYEVLFATPKEYKRTKKILDEKGFYSGEVMNKKADGTVFKSFLSANVIYDSDGKIIGSMGISRDITKQEEIELALKKSEANFRQIASTTSEVFYLYNIVKQKYEYMSPNCLEIIGADQDFFYTGQSHTKLVVHPDDRKILDDAKHLVDSGTAYDIEYRIIIDDEVRWINEKSFPIKDENGNVVRNSGTCRDVTEAKEAREIIYKQNSEIGQSIIYAKNIQNSTLPTEEEMKNVLPESFVYFSPKDILSGDFYLVDNVKLIDGSGSVPTFIVADCTGHGVPGGILSLLCISLIQESFTNYKVNTPAEALDFISAKLVKFFRSNRTSHIKDGMDVSFCVLYPVENKLAFAGANTSCIIVRNNEMHEHKGDKQHVGYNENQLPFTNHMIDVQKGDVIYLFTDGYMDQFGGEDNRKFMRKRFHDMLLDIHEESIELQYEIVKSTFLEWRGSQEQTDDVTVFGFRY